MEKQFHVVDGVDDEGVNDLENMEDEETEEEEEEEEKKRGGRGGGRKRGGGGEAGGKGTQITCQNTIASE